jgi:hypothetical protein
MKGIIPGMGALMTWTIIPSTRVQIFLVGYYPSIGGHLGCYPYARPSWLLAKSVDMSKPPLVSRILRVGHQTVGHVSDTRLERVMFTGHACLENKTHVLLSKGPWLMFSHASCSCEVF